MVFELSRFVPPRLLVPLPRGPRCAPSGDAGGLCGCFPGGFSTFSLSRDNDLIETVLMQQLAALRLRGSSLPLGERGLDPLAASVRHSPRYVP